MTRRILAGIAGLIICAAAYAAGTSIWNASPRGTVSGTDRIPVATSGSSGPLYVTPATVKAYTFTPPISAQVADSTSAGGNARGANAVDWQTSRSEADDVASGVSSVVTGGASNTASGDNAAVTGGEANTASGDFSAVIYGTQNTASQLASLAGGSQASATAQGAITLGWSTAANADYAFVHGFEASSSGMGSAYVHGGYGFTGVYGHRPKFVRVPLLGEGSADTQIPLVHDTESGTGFVLPSTNRNLIGIINAVVTVASTDNAYVISWEVKATYKHNGNSATPPVFIGTPDVVKMEGNFPVTDPTLDVDAGSDARIEFKVTGADGTGGSYGGDIIAVAFVSAYQSDYFED